MPNLVSASHHKLNIKQVGYRNKFGMTAQIKRNNYLIGSSPSIRSFSLMKKNQKIKNG